MESMPIGYRALTQASREQVSSSSYFKRLTGERE